MFSVSYMEVVYVILLSVVVGFLIGVLLAGGDKRRR